MVLFPFIGLDNVVIRQTNDEWQLDKVRQDKKMQSVIRQYPVTRSH